MFDLLGKKALVTGSTQGIGLAIAEGLAKQGSTVFINGGSGYEKCKKVASQIPGSQIAYGNLENSNCADKMFEITGMVDILVLNASVQYRRKWDETNSEEFDRQIRINLKSNFELIQKYAPFMKRQRWGRILAIGSVQQYKPHKDMIIYAAGKCAQLSMVKNFAKQLAPWGITVNSLSPGVIATLRNASVLSDSIYKKGVLESIPCGYVGTPQDCVAGALLLCSEEGRYITGTDLVIDGGMRL